MALAGTEREMEDERQRVIDGELLGLLVGDGCAEAKEESVGKGGVGEAVKGLEKDEREEALPKGVWEPVLRGEMEAAKDKVPQAVVESTLVVEGDGELKKEGEV